MKKIISVPLSRIERLEIKVTGCRKTMAQVKKETGASHVLNGGMWNADGSSQCDFEGQQIKASRKVHNWICVYTNDDKEEKPVGSKYQVTPSIGVNIRSGPGTGYGKVGAYPCGTVVEVTTTQNGWGQTAKGWISMDYVQALEPVQRVTDTGLGIQADYIPAGRANRPGGSNPGTYITIHETGNAAKGADAAAHANYLKGDAAAKAMVSWHYTVDDHGIVQHLPDQETAYHAGDGASGTGNTKSIGVEICVNAGGDFNKAKANAASLVRLLMKEHGIPLANVVQHNHWTGKDCPYTIRHTAGGWEAFLALCEGRGEVVSELDTDVDTLAAAGILTAADYWKGGDYSAANVQALIGKMADYVREGK